MKTYLQPILNVVPADAEDILTVSGTLIIGGTDGSFGNGDQGLSDIFI